MKPCQPSCCHPRYLRARYLKLSSDCVATFILSRKVADTPLICTVSCPMNSLPVILPPRNHLRAITHRDCLNARKLCTRRVLCTASPISPASDSIKPASIPAHQSSTGRAEQIIHSLESEIEQMFTKGVRCDGKSWIGMELHAEVLSMN